MNKLEQAITAAKGNLAIVDALTKADSVINHSGYKNIVVSVSGGADSDIMLDLVERIWDTDAKITYYGFNRTGCACCPFGGKDVEKELTAIKEHEPRLYKACMKVFGASYEYTRRFYAFRAEMDTKRGG